jgi:hypothetical protein
VWIVLVLKKMMANLCRNLYFVLSFLEVKVAIVVASLMVEVGINTVLPLSKNRFQREVSS